MIEELEILNSRIEIINAIQMIGVLMTKAAAKGLSGGEWYVTLESQKKGLISSYMTFVKLTDQNKRIGTLNYDLSLSNSILEIEKGKLLKMIEGL